MYCGQSGYFLKKPLVFKKKIYDQKSAFAFVNWTIEQNGTSQCPNYTYRLHPHSDIQPVLLGIIFSPAFRIFPDYVT